MHKSHPSHVDFKNGLAVSYDNLGSLYVDQLNNKEKGIPYLQKAFQLWEALTAKHPSYAEFQRNYSSLVERLKNIEEN